MTSAGTAWIAVQPDMKNWNSDVSRGIQGSGEKAATSFSSSFKSKLKIGTAIGAAFATAAAGNFLKGSIKQASDLAESVNAVNVTFGKSAAGIHELGKSAATSLGLSRSEFNGLAVQFSSFASTIAGKGGDVTGVMKELSTRGADFASVMNLDVNQAMELFQSGLAGESEPLRKFGINLSAAAVESHAYAKGIAAAGKPLTENQKVQARYSLLMQQTSKVQGDFANTSDSLANSQRILGAKWDDIQAKVGGKLMPVLADLSSWVADKGLPGLEKMANFLKDNSTEVKLLAGVIGGLTLITAAHGVAMGVAAAGGLKAYLVGTKLISGALKVWTAVQWALNAALLANPIGIAIAALAALVGGLILAYKKSDTFRAVVDKAWKVVGEGARWLWNNALAPTFRFILGGLAGLMDMWAKLLKAMGKVPNFEWAAVAGRKLEAAADKVRGLRSEIKDLDGKKATVTIDVYVPPLTAGERNTLNAISQGNFVGGSGPNAPDMKPIEFRAAGGPVRGMRPYVVGEKGPELFVPRISGSIIPNHRLGSSPGTGLEGAQLGGAGSGANITINQTMPATATPEQASAAAGGRIVAALEALGV